MTGPVIKLKGYRIKNIEYNLIIDNLENQAEDVVNNTSVKCSLTNELDFGQIELSSTFNDISNDRTINVTLLGQFDINPDLDDEEEIKKYLALNGTAILYPYLRSVVSMVSSLDSDSAILLPTVNVNELMNEEN